MILAPVIEGACSTTCRNCALHAAPVLLSHAAPLARRTHRRAQAHGLAQAPVRVLPTRAYTASHQVSALPDIHVQGHVQEDTGLLAQALTHGQSVLQPMRTVQHELEQEMDALDWQLSMMLLQSRALPLAGTEGLQRHGEPEVDLLAVRATNEAVGYPAPGSVFGGCTYHRVRPSPLSPHSTHTLQQTHSVLPRTVPAQTHSTSASSCVLLDTSERATQLQAPLYTVCTLQPSPCGTLYAFTDTPQPDVPLPHRGAQYTLHVHDSATGAPVMQPLQHVTGPLMWSPCGQQVYYTCDRGRTLQAVAVPRAQAPIPQQAVPHASTHAPSAPQPRTTQPAARQSSPSPALPQPLARRSPQLPRPHCPSPPSVHPTTVLRDPNEFVLMLRRLRCQTLGADMQRQQTLDTGSSDITSSAITSGPSAEETLLVCQAIDSQSNTRELWVLLPTANHHNHRNHQPAAAQTGPTNSTRTAAHSHSAPEATHADNSAVASSLGGCCPQWQWQCVLPRSPGSRHLYLPVKTAPTSQTALLVWHWSCEVPNGQLLWHTLPHTAPTAGCVANGSPGATGDPVASQQPGAEVGGASPGNCQGTATWDQPIQVQGGDTMCQGTASRQRTAPTSDAQGTLPTTTTTPQPSVLLAERESWRIVGVRVRGRLVLLTLLRVPHADAVPQDRTTVLDSTATSRVRYEVHQVSDDDSGNMGAAGRGAPVCRLVAEGQVVLPCPTIHVSALEWATVPSHILSGQPDSQDAASEMSDQSSEAVTHCVEAVYSGVGVEPRVVPLPLQPPHPDAGTSAAQPPTDNPASHHLPASLTLPSSLSDIQHTRLITRSRDGTPVHVTLAYAPRAAAADSTVQGVGTGPTQPNPLEGVCGPVLLDVYGAYGVEDSVEYTLWRSALLQRGWIVAVPHVRGGGGPHSLGDVGDVRWHQAGCLGSKQRGVEDVLAVAEALVHEGWAEGGRVSLVARSAGGWLAGAALVQRPSLFHAAALTVPALDAHASSLDNAHEVGAAPTRQDSLNQWCPVSTLERVQTLAAAQPHPACSEGIAQGADSSNDEMRRSWLTCAEQQRWPDVLVRVAGCDRSVSMWEGVRFHKHLTQAMQQWDAAATTFESHTDAVAERASTRARVALVARDGGHDAFDDTSGAAEAAAFLLTSVLNRQ